MEGFEPFLLSEVCAMSSDRGDACATEGRERASICRRAGIAQQPPARSDTNYHNTQQSQENREERERGGREIRVFNSLIAKTIQDSAGFTRIQ